MPNSQSRYEEQLQFKLSRSDSSGDNILGIQSRHPLRQRWNASWKPFCASVWRPRLFRLLWSVTPGWQKPCRLHHLRAKPRYNNSRWNEYFISSDLTSLGFCRGSQSAKQTREPSDMQIKPALTRDWGDGSVVESTDCSHRRPRFNSQHPWWQTTVCKSSSRGSDAFLWPLIQCIQAVNRHTFSQVLIHTK